jgi:hypothetical protein
MQVSRTHDELMQKSGVLPKKVPILDLYKDRERMQGTHGKTPCILGGRQKFPVLNS